MSDGSRPRLLALAGLGAWIALLATPLVQPGGRARLAGSDLFDLRSRRALAVAGVSLGRMAALETAGFVPLGVLAVLALPPRRRGAERALLVVLPAFLAGLAGATLALRARAAGDPLAAPGASDLALPALGVFLGCYAALAWRRDARSLLWMLPKLALAAATAALVVGGLLLVLCEGEPLVPPAAPIHSDDKRGLVALFRGRDPRKVPEGETRTLRLAASDLERLAAWGLPVIFGAERVRARFELGGDGTAAAQASVRLPVLRRWLNLRASLRPHVSNGNPSLESPRLRIGRVDLPAPLLDLLAPALTYVIRSERRLRPVWPVLEEVRVEEGVLVARYGPLRSPPGYFSSLIWGGRGSDLELREAVAANARRILELAGEAPPGDARFDAALGAALAEAWSRAAGGGSALLESRAAILAFGSLVGTRKLDRLVGGVLDTQDPRLADLEQTSLRGRRDWAQHFAVSAALTVLAAVAPSQEAGLLKEELDAYRGSGFSFADLLADRAGTAFAAALTPDEATAGRLLSRWSHGMPQADVFPPADGLPEGIPDLELQGRYGGVGGARYAELLSEIDRRVSACPAHASPGAP